MKMNYDATDVCESLLGLIDVWRIAMVEVAEENGLTKVQMFSLYALHLYGKELPMNHVASLLHCDASNVTGIVDRLAAQDLIVREECVHDRRAKILRITAKGEALVMRLRTALPDRLGCSRLDKEERAQLVGLLGKMVG